MAQHTAEEAGEARGSGSVCVRGVQPDPNVEPDERGRRVEEVDVSAARQAAGGEGERALNHTLRRTSGAGKNRKDLCVSHQPVREEMWFAAGSPNTDSRPGPRCHDDYVAQLETSTSPRLRVLARTPGAS